MEWRIVTDSSCNLPEHKMKLEHIYFRKVPFRITFKEKAFIDDTTVEPSNLLTQMEKSFSVSSTSCPATGEWLNCFTGFSHIIAVTISSELSGSYNSAIAARNMALENDPKKNILIIDSKSAGPALDLLVLKAVELVKHNYSINEIEDLLLKYANDIHTIFALSSFNNLVANGRMSKFTAVVAGKLNIWGIGIASKEGRINIKKKIRGNSRVVQVFLDDLNEQNFSGSPVIINHCENLALAFELKKAITKLWEHAIVDIYPMGGICSYYAERKGIMLAF